MSEKQPVKRPVKQKSAKTNDTALGQDKQAMSKSDYVTMVSRKDYPIMLTLTDSSSVKLTKHKKVRILRSQLPETLPPGVQVF